MLLQNITKWSSYTKTRPNIIVNGLTLFCYYISVYKLFKFHVIFILCIFSNDFSIDAYLILLPFFPLSIDDAFTFIWWVTKQTRSEWKSLRCCTCDDDDDDSIVRNVLFIPFNYQSSLSLNRNWMDLKNVGWKECKTGFFFLCESD